MTQPPLIVILGPTASGKTDLAVELAKEFNGEIVNADSRQVYKEINIASAKPPLIRRPPLYPLLNKEGTVKRLPLAKGEQEGVLLYQGVPHHLFDIVTPNESFNVTHWQRLAIETTNDIHRRGHLPFLVGGTGLWISAVVDNLDFPPVPPNEKLRKQLESSRDAYMRPLRAGEHCSPHRKGVACYAPTYGQGSALPLQTKKLYDELIKLDPAAASFIDPKNRRRIIRALEVISATGKPFSAQRGKRPPPFRTLLLGLTRPVQELEERISSRLREQIKKGLELEVRTLFAKYSSKLPALSSISLREWRAYFNGAQTYEKTLNLIRLHNRQYAKRQMTWFKKDERIRWIENKDGANEARCLIQNFL